MNKLSLKIFMAMNTFAIRVSQALIGPGVDASHSYERTHTEALGVKVIGEEVLRQMCEA